MTDSAAGRHTVSSLNRGATALAAATVIAAVAATVAVTAAAQWTPDDVVPIAVVGLLVAAVLAIATTLQQHRAAEVALESESDNAASTAAQEEMATAGLARARFIADISHDLRQPLHALGLFLDALEKRVTPGEGEKVLARTREASGVLNRAFNALIDLTRVEADALVPEIELFSLDALLSRVGEECASVSSGVGLDLKVVHTHAPVATDERLLGHVLRTLLANALDNAPGRLLLGVRHRGGRISIELHCSSPGKRIAKWDVLNSADPTHPASRNVEELDLLVARRLADLMGLDLRFVAKSDRGFKLSIGLAQAHRRPDAPLSNRSVLFVSDDAAARVTGASALACAGAVVHVAGNLRQAEHVAQNGRFDVLVTNVSADDPIARQTRARIAGRAPDLTCKAPMDGLVAAVVAKLSA